MGAICGRQVKTFVTYILKKAKAEAHKTIWDYNTKKLISSAYAYANSEPNLEYIRQQKPFMGEFQNKLWKYSQRSVNFSALIFFLSYFKLYNL